MSWLFLVLDEFFHWLMLPAVIHIDGCNAVTLLHECNWVMFHIHFQSNTVMAVLFNTPGISCAGA